MAPSQSVGWLVDIPLLKAIASLALILRLEACPAGVVCSCFHFLAHVLISIFLTNLMVNHIVSFSETPVPFFTSSALLSMRVSTIIQDFSFFLDPSLSIFVLDRSLCPVKDCLPPEKDCALLSITSSPFSRDPSSSSRSSSSVIRHQCKHNLLL